MRMHIYPSIGLLAAITPLWLGVGSARLLGIPTEPFEETSGSYSLKGLKSIIVDSAHVDSVDKTGQTLIPPTLGSFANTFSEDIKSALGIDVPVSEGDKAAKNSIFLTVGDSIEFKDVAGRKTAEGYSWEVTADGITVTGASPLGAWWGTRTILQQSTLGGGKIAQGSGTTAPGWGTRGSMLDVGRHYYKPEFLIEICSYLSFFKQNTFHVHLSDNLIYDPDYYTTDDTQYSAFRPMSDDPAVAGLNTRANESYTRTEFDNIQQKCANRGVAVIPEIEAPGHSQVFTNWKPELALDTDASLLNITHPDTIPTMETVWKTFFPWFHSKTVHIGADEYDRSLVDDYMNFVNALNDYIVGESGKSIRIWGTFAPSLSDTVSVDKDVVIQHWEHQMANPYLDYLKNGYKVLNSDSYFYLVSKHNAYPTTYPVSRVFEGNPAGGAYAPNILDSKKADNNPPRNEPNIIGHIAALWNDGGPNSTSYSEPYYAWRQILPALADTQWGGDLNEAEFHKVFEKLHAAIPAQNLDRAIPSETDKILQYNFAETDKVVDTSGNGYNGKLHGACTIKDAAIAFGKDCYIETPLSSKGRNYTLSFSVKKTSDKPGTLFSGRDSTLLSGDSNISNVMLIAAGNAFVVDYTLPVDSWVDVSLIGRGEQTLLEVSDGKQTVTKEFVAGLGISAGQQARNVSIAIEAPLAKIGEGFEGAMKKISLLGSA